eukprot:scaffold5749_cov149-Ochromonas_danica.AAC.1
MRDKKRREREAKASRELEKARKAATKGEKQRIMELMESGALSAGKKGNTPNLLVGEPFFCTNPVCAQQRQCVVGRRWMVRLFGMLCTVRSLVLQEEGFQVEVDATHEWSVCGSLSTTSQRPQCRNADASVLPRTRVLTHIPKIPKIALNENPEIRKACMVRLPACEWGGIAVPVMEATKETQVASKC